SPQRASPLRRSPGWTTTSPRSCTRPGPPASRKGVAVSHANLWALTSAVVAYLGLTEADRLASLLPFSFVYGVGQLLCAVGAGAALVVERSPLPQQMIETIRSEGVTVLAAVPPLWTRLLRVPAFVETPLPRLRV